MAVRVRVHIYVSMPAGGGVRYVRACVCVYLCIYFVLPHFNHAEQTWTRSLAMTLCVPSFQVLELDFCLPDLDETANMLLPEAAQLNQDNKQFPLGDWHCEHSPAHGSNLDKDRKFFTISLASAGNGKVQSH